jgi:glucokinase
MEDDDNMKPFAVGIDVGGSKIAAGLVNREGKINACFTTRAHSEKEPRYVIDAIEAAYHSVLKECGVSSSEVEGVCMGFAGTVNGPAGMILISSNLPAWHQMPLRDTVAERIGMPVILENDTNLCGLGEFYYGAGRGSRNMCYVTFSTGYGLGIIIDGKLYVGATGTAGEVAHIVVDVGGPPCTCGKNGCLMSYASGVGISRMAYDAIDAGKETLLRAHATPDRKRIGGEAVAEAASQGDPVAQEIIQTAGYYFGVGLSIIAQIVNPELIVYGGGLTNLGNQILEPAMLGLRENIQPELLDSFQLKPWQLGEQVGVIGAGALVFETMKQA